MQEYLQEVFIPGVEQINTKTSPEKQTGSRITPSQIEKLTDFYELRKKSNSEESFLKQLELEQQPQEKESLIENAKNSIYGTQLHYLQYFAELFSRSSKFNRLPIYQDFQFTFPNKDTLFYESMIDILTLSADYSETEDEYIQNFWNEWRMNKQDFTPKKHKRYVVEPSIIRDIWENGVIPLEDIKTFKTNFTQTDKEKLDPRNALLMNELLLITNLYLKDGNLQIPTMIDEIIIPKDFPNKPIKIIDYKTGKQFKYPEQKEQIQIFLMMTSVVASIMDKAKIINYNLSSWDATHNSKNIPFPFFMKRGLIHDIRPIGSIQKENFENLENVFTSLIEFSYINPLTQEEIKIDANEIGLGNKEDISNILSYLNDLTNFYSEYKHILKHLVSSENSPYTLPSFPSKSGKNNSREVQIAFNF